MTREEMLTVAKPIIFCGDMVRAILDGRKTMTRRVIKPDIADRFVIGLTGELIGSYSEKYTEPYPTVDDSTYQYGDILYVRETWWGNGTYDYKADYYKGDKNDDVRGNHLKWRSSIHMPKAAARIFLRVTDVRAESVQDITVDDAISEGAWGNGMPTLPMSLLWKEHPTASCNAAAAFAHLWDSINAKRGYGWDENPWVWVISFERIV